MNQLLFPTSLIVLAFIAILIPSCWAVIGPFSDEGGDAVKGHNQVLQNTFDELVQRRRRAAHDQVVALEYDTKENKSITGLSQAEKDYLLLVHNAYRSAVQPFAANMMEVVWDDDIAAFAQDWANHCKAKHRKIRNLNKWINMGENIYWIYSGSYHEGYSTKFWWDEVQWYNYSTQYCEPKRQCGHYVTMTWASTSRIGCGVNRCDRLWALPDYGRGAYYFVCNYSGRFISYKRPYKRHSTICSYCYKTSAPKCRYNLCVTKDMLDYDIGYSGSTAEIGFNRTKTFSSLKSPITPAPSPATSSLLTSPDATVVSTSLSTPSESTGTTDPEITSPSSARLSTPSTEATMQSTMSDTPQTETLELTSLPSLVSTDSQTTNTDRTSPTSMASTVLTDSTASTKDKPFVVDAVDEIINSGSVSLSLSIYTFVSVVILISRVIYC